MPASGAGDRSVGREMRNDCELNWYETQIEFSHWRRGAAWAAVGPAAQVPFSSLALRSSYENEEAISLPLLVIAQSRDSNARTDNDGDDDEQPPAAAGEGGRLLPPSLVRSSVRGVSLVGLIAAAAAPRCPTQKYGRRDEGGGERASASDCVRLRSQC